jgi:hypothetical protein
MKKFIITEEERNRILGMHKSATSKHYLMEQTSGETLSAEYFKKYPKGKVTTSGYAIQTVNGIKNTYLRLQSDDNMETSRELQDLPDPTEWEYYPSKDGQHILLIDLTGNLTANYSIKI